MDVYHCFYPRQNVRNVKLTLKNKPFCSIFVVKTFCHVFFFLSSHRVLQQLDIGTDKGSIEKESLSKIGVFLGMFTTFGLLRTPSILASLFHVFVQEGNADTPAEQFFVHLTTIIVPLQGFFIYLWFSHKFKYREIWTADLASRDVKPWWAKFVMKGNLGTETGEMPLVESISGMY